MRNAYHPANEAMSSTFQSGLSAFRKSSAGNDFRASDEKETSGGGPKNRTGGTDQPPLLIYLRGDSSDPTLFTRFDRKTCLLREQPEHLSHALSILKRHRIVLEKIEHLADDRLA